MRSAKPVDNLTHHPWWMHDRAMAGMKIISMLDHEVAKARQVAQRDLEEMQRRVLQVTTALADSLVALADRVTALEQSEQSRPER
jgi:hypothetical protein